MRQQFILCFGLDTALVRTRQRVFQSAKYASEAVHSFEEVRRCFSEHAVVDVLVICHSVTRDLCVKATHLAHERVVPARVLLLYKGVLKCEADQDATFDSSLGPERLLKALSALLIEQESEIFNAASTSTPVSKEKTAYL